VRPTGQQETLAHAQHVAPTALQVQHERMAAADPQLRASVNQGRPPIAATAWPAAFAGRGVEAARPVTAAGATARPVGAAARPAGTAGLAGAMPAEPSAARPALRGPGNEAHPAVEAGHPSFAAAHPAVPANHAAVPAYHAAAPTYHAAAPAYHAAAPASRAAAPAYHAAAPSYHPTSHAAAPAYHAAARPAAPAPHAAPRQQETKRG
jgi:hypothetical protein